MIRLLGTDFGYLEYFVAVGWKNTPLAQPLSPRRRYVRTLFKDLMAESGPIMNKRKLIAFYKKRESVA